MKYLLTLVAAIVVFAAIADAVPPEKGVRSVLKAVIHISFDNVERQQHGMGNIENILKEAPEAEVEVVCHGKGISLVDSNQTTYAEQILALIERGVCFVARENTMIKEGIQNGQLVAGVTTVHSEPLKFYANSREATATFALKREWT